MLRLKSMHAISTSASDTICIRVTFCQGSDNSRGGRRQDREIQRRYACTIVKNWLGHIEHSFTVEAVCMQQRNEVDRAEYTQNV